MAVLLACLLPLLLAEAPSWWQGRGVLKTNGGQPVAASDFAAANQGQLKQFALGLYEEFLANADLAALGGIGSMAEPPSQNLPEGPGNRAGTGWRIRELISQWVELDPTTGRVLRAVLNGQGQPTAAFSGDGTGARKLTAAGAQAKDFSAINLGQLKAVVLRSSGCEGARAEWRRESRRAEAGNAADRGSAARCRFPRSSGELRYLAPKQ